MYKSDSNLKTTKTDSKMTSKLVYDVKGLVCGVNKSYKDMSDSEITKLMEKERFSLTCAPGGENNRGMEIIGRMPIKGEGFTAADIEGLGPYFEKLMCGDMKGNEKAFVLDLNALSLDEFIDNGLEEEDQARVLILRDWAAKTMGAEAWTKEVFKELASRRWDAEYLDPNKYRTEIVDGNEVKVRGKRMNKLARTNLCFVAGREQEPAVYEGKGTIYDLKKMEFLNRGVERLRQQIADGLIEIGSKTKVEINVVEGNRYYNLKNTGIGFHGDTERVVVICISIGCDNYPMRWQWFKDGMPVGKSIDVTLNCGDVYIMSEKAVGADWKKKSLYTLRHSAGANKYRDLSKWEKKRPAYEAKMADKVKKKAEKEAAKQAKLDFKAKKAASNDKINKGKTTKNGAKKKMDPIKLATRRYKNALRKHDWVNNKEGFYKWLAIESAYEISPNHIEIKELNDIWTGKVENWAQKMIDNENIIKWNEYKATYDTLCIYGKYF